MTTTYDLIMTEETQDIDQEEVRENMLGDFENSIWQAEQKNPIQLVKDMIEWVDNDSFSELNWSTEDQDKLNEMVEDLGIWLATMVNPYSSQGWDDYLKIELQCGRTARIVSYILQARKNTYKKAIDLFNKARAQLELQSVESKLDGLHD